MNILVTGGAGFIGSNFIRYMMGKYPDYKIVNLDLLTYAGSQNNLVGLESSTKYKFVKGDINDYQLVFDCLKNNKIELIVHFAAESHVDRSISGPDIFLTTNILGTANLLKCALENNVRFHHISTDEVFGSLESEKGKFTESTCYNPRSPYSASKAAADHLVRAYHNTYGLPVTISNCSNNYGPYQHKEKLIPLFITNLLQDQPVPLYGDGTNIRDWLYVSDHCQAIDLIIHNGKVGQTYLIGGDSEVSNMDIAKMLCDKMGKSHDLIQPVADRPGHDWRYAIDFSKIKNELGWQPTVSLDQGLQLTIDWYKK